MSKRESDGDVALTVLTGAGTEPKKSVDTASMSPDRELQYHAADGNVEGVRKAFQAGGKVNVPHLAEPEKVETEKGEDPVVPNHPITGDYPLHMAASGGHLEAVGEILNLEADIEAQNRMGSTALHRAVSHNHPLIVQKLLKEGASIDATNKIGNTPLHCAAFGGFVEIARSLLDASAAVHIHQSNKIGFTPLSYARIASKPMTLLLLNYKKLDSEDKTKSLGVHVDDQGRESKSKNRQKEDEALSLSPTPSQSASPDSLLTVPATHTGSHSVSAQTDIPSRSASRGSLGGDGVDAELLVPPTTSASSSFSGEFEKEKEGSQVHGPSDADDADLSEAETVG